MTECVDTVCLSGRAHRDHLGSLQVRGKFAARGPCLAAPVVRVRLQGTAAQRSELGTATDAGTPSARLSIGARELQVGRELKNDVLHARHGVRKSLRTSDTASEKKSLAVSGMSGRYSFNPTSHLL